MFYCKFPHILGKLHAIEIGKTSSHPYCYKLDHRLEPVVLRLTGENRTHGPILMPKTIPIELNRLKHFRSNHLI